MPRKKQHTVAKSKKKTTPRVSRIQKISAVKMKKTTFLKNQRTRFLSVKWTESYSSFLLGVVVVIIAALFGLTILRQQHPLLQQTTSLQTGPTPAAVVSPTPGTTIVENGKTYYVVKADDSLWTIAENFYKDGYSWTKIAKANNLANPSTIFASDKLLLPGIESGATSLGQLTKTQNTEHVANEITGTSYTVQKNDSLWDIAVRAYADGYSWTKIAKVNHLANPDVIFSGNVLQIPR